MKWLTILLCSILIFSTISFVSAEELSGIGTHAISIGDKILLKDVTIEIKDIDTKVHIIVGNEEYSLGTKDEITDITSSVSVKATGILVNQNRATLYVEERDNYNGDGSYEISTGDMVTADNGYKIKINGAYSPYVAWWYNLSLISPDNNLIYTFSYSLYGETPIYSKEDEKGDIVLYIKITTPDAGAGRIILRSVNNDEGCKPRDHKECGRDNNDDSHVYWVDSCNNREEAPFEYCNERGCYIPTTSCVESPIKKEKNCPTITLPNCPDKTELEEEKDSNGCIIKNKCKKKLSNGRNAEIKIMPETASEKAIQKLGELNFTIELKEIGKGDNTKLIYELTGKKNGRFLGIFKIQAKIQTQIDAETGDIIKTTKPWWSFLATKI